MERICVIGTGYVGLVAGALFASVGHKVACVDIDEKKIASLTQGHIPIYEPGLGEIVKGAVAAGALTFTTDVQTAVKGSKVHVIAVGTPSKEDGAFDPVYILAAARDIGRALRGEKGHRVVVMKSTVDADMFAQARDALLAELSDDDRKRLEIDLVSNPEFMAEGTAVRDFSRPHRVIIGTDSERAKEAMLRIYKDFAKTDPHRILFMSPQSAIVAKLASNGMLALKVAFMDEIAQYCDAVGADVEQVRVGMSYDPRIGQHFLFAGPGYGGSCFPKDIQALRASSSRERLSLKVVGAVEESNDAHKRYLPRKAEEFFAARGGLEGRTIALWGLAFKARTDDVRESPALDVIRYLLERGAKVRVHDPQAMENARKALGDMGGKVAYCARKEDALEGASALIVLTEWDEYRNPDHALLAQSLSERMVFDGRNILDAATLAAHGIGHMGIGRGSRGPDSHDE